MFTFFAGWGFTDWIHLTIEVGELATLGILFYLVVRILRWIRKQECSGKK